MQIETDQVKRLNELYKNYFSKNNCNQLLNILHKFSALDCILCSGSSTIMVEYKRRFVSSFEYESAIIERQKFDNMQETVRLFDAPGWLYVNDYTDGLVLCWFVHDDSRIQWDTQLCPSSDGATDKMEKQIGYLMHSQADIVISKKTWNRISGDLFENYLKTRSLGFVW